MKYSVNDYLGFIKISMLKQKNEIKRADGLSVLITGATSGVGLSTSIKFAKMGANLILLVRDNIKAVKIKNDIEEKYKVKVLIYTADFEKLEHLNNTLNNILSDNVKIDILINNAGVYRTKRKILPNNLDSVLVVNHLASLLITLKLVSIIKNSNLARVVNVNSEGHRFGNINLDDLNFTKRFYSGLRSYGASKTAQLHTMYVLEDILFKDGVVINSMHPGAVRSNIGSKSGKLYNLYMNYFLKYFLKKPEISAEALYYICVSNEMEGVTGKFYNLTNLETPAPHAQKSDFSLVVFKKSFELIKEYI